MAITFRAGANASGTTAVTITKPTGTVDADVMTALVIHNGSAQPTAPTGWTRLAAVNLPTTALLVVDRRVASGEGANYTWTPPDASVTEGIILAFDGVDNTTPEDATTTSATGTTGTITWPNITTVTDLAWHLTLVGDSSGGASTTTPTNYTSRQTSATYTKGSSREITPAGLVSGVTATGGANWAAVSVALRPATAGGTTFPGWIGTHGGWF